MNLARMCILWFNERAKKKWTLGEIIKHWGAMGAAALANGVPLKELWKEEAGAGDLFDPIALGRHGVHKNRHMEFVRLQGLMFTQEEDELDATAGEQVCAGRVRLGALFSDRKAEWSKMESTKKKHKMRRAIDRRFDGPKHRRTRDYDSDDSMGGMGGMGFMMYAGLW